MEMKMRHRKTSYTVMIASDSAKHPVRKYHLKKAAVRILVSLSFILLVVAICYGVYTSITLSDTVARNKKQAEQISQMKAEAEKLTRENGDLNEEISIMSVTINQKVEAEQALAALQEETHMPTGFPLSGSAQIKSGDAAALQEDGQTQETTQTEIVFEATSGVNVVASGGGVVTSIDTDVEYGNVMRIDHGNGYISIYKNSGSPVVKVDSEVLKGAVLFVVGEDNGELGYQIEHEGTLIDPLTMIEISG